MSLRRAGLAALAALVLAPAAWAAPGDDARRAIRAVDRLEAAGKLQPSEARKLRVVIRRARAELRLLPGPRSAVLGAVLRQVARNGARAGPARLRVLVATLDQNANYLGVNDIPAPLSYARDAHGVVYRAFPGVGLQFHPLQSFARLNALVTEGKRYGSVRLAVRLLQLGQRRGGARTWAYEFPFGGGSPPWISGMAQSVAAQALARTAASSGAVELLRAAGQAYAAVPGRLVQRVSGRRVPWIRLYSFNDLVVLNAQLQSALSLEDYGRLADDLPASQLARRLRRAAATLLPRFDTGYWSRYSLVGESSLGYHVYVVSLLEKLARRTGRPFWQEASSRFARYTREPPEVESRSGRRTLYPWPADGWRDVATVRIWLSKRSAVTVRIGGRRWSLSLGQGIHAFPWAPPAGRTGRFRVRVTAVDLAGNRSTTRLEPVPVRVDRKPPRVEAALEGPQGRRLTWKAVDRGTPHVRLVLRLRNGDRVKTRSLGVHDHEGSLWLFRAARRWKASLHVIDVSGNRARVPLGEYGGRPEPAGAVPTIG